jgi:hypothetical protein
MKNFTNFTFKSMKKILLSVALVAFIMLGAMSDAKAMTVTFYVKIFLSDNCLPSGYNGSYCVRLNLLYKNAVLCTAENCTVVKNSTGICYSFTCEIDAIAEEPYYGVALVSAYRYPSGLCSSTNYSTSGAWYWDEMTTYPCNYAWLSVAL